MQTRLISLYGDETIAMNRFETSVRDAPDDPVNQYGYGLILARVGNRKAAIEHLKKALEKRAFDPFYLTDLGRVYYLDGQFQDALKTIGGALSIDPEYPGYRKVLREVGYYYDLETGEIMDKDRFRQDMGGFIEAYTEVLDRVSS